MVILSFLLLATVLPIGSSPSPKHFKIEKLAPGVWAAIHNDQYGGAICNAGIVDLGDKTIVFDPFMTPEAAKDLKDIARQLTGRHVSLVVNSHFHNDHIRGNQVFVPAAAIVSTEWTRKKMMVSEPDEQKWEKENAGRLAAAEREKIKTATGSLKEESIMWLAYYEGMERSLPQLKLTLPDITFSDSLWIHGKERSVKLLEFRNGHTSSDVVMIVPKEGIAFMGDLFFVKRHPWLGDGDPKLWHSHLNYFKDNETIRFLVPGHGPVTGREAVQPLQNYMVDVAEVVENGYAKGLPDSLIVKETVPEQYGEWWFGRFYLYNLRFLCRQKEKKD